MSTLLRKIKALFRPVVEEVRVAKGTQKRSGELPDWAAIIATNPTLWADAKKRAETGPRVLMATAVGGHPQFTVLESALNIALTLRGVKVDTLICDAALPACLRSKISGIDPQRLVRGELSQVFCEGCYERGKAVFGKTDLERIELGRLLTDEDRQRAQELSRTVPTAEIADFQFDGLPVGEHCSAGALRYYGIGDLSGEPEGDEVLRRYLESGLLVVLAMRRLLQTNRYDAIVTNHGIYTPHGIINAVARSANIHTVAWNLAYRAQCAIFSHNDTYHHTLMNEPVSAWENMAWSPKHEKDILTYLDSRRGGSRDWIWFNRDADEDMARFAAEVGLDLKKPIIGMLTNVVWDAQLHYPANAFSGMLDWVEQTVKYFAGRPDLQLVVRVHPGELAPPGGQTVSRQPVAEAIMSYCGGNLPPNIFIIPPESKTSTYAVADRCNAVIIYGTKTGVELTARGIPVIVAGEAWIRNKGLTMDVESSAAYFSLLDTLPLASRLDEAQTVRARKYAYHFFFRRMVPVPFLVSVPDSWPPYRIELSRLDELLPTRFPGLDVLCDGIVSGAPFIYEAERLTPHDLH
ncbi:hypothetical protein BJ123_10557 [Rhodopseudomonas thermotolerans]|uniref:Capsular polysaccharide biosynthesis protein n=2 Tax=Rhodopseudomonas TaxID=1073 RepID=A0A336JMF8_9BRAD|nr:MULTISPECIES: capsular biosynthesis protein [Rhodopseudomonas]RED37978.1 hypothetical protein BJ125_10557 [Rhodopseudomonas pentothenatexigens]REG05171.1 hypothetical protein BJ123_10557 [Rhodopseudomonas thermotolerans]SSW90003.1 hypothetical protein SAMN05892882_10557 [Rhodopseudomonas pentothenatexigens]